MNNFAMNILVEDIFRENFTGWTFWRRSFCKRTFGDWHFGEGQCNVKDFGNNWVTYDKLMSRVPLSQYNSYYIVISNLDYQPFFKKMK